MNIKIIPKTRLTFLLLFLFELISFFCYLFPNYEKIAFFIIILFALYISYRNLKLGLLLIFIELIIGSKGYLFYFDFFGINMSIRIALWIIIMSFWLAKLVIEIIKYKSNFKKINSIKFLYSKNSKYFIILFVFIIWGLINGLLHNNSFNNLFFDFNGWLFFLLIFPLFSTINNQNDIYDFLKIGLISTIWICLKTYILLFLFSHNIYGITYEIYRWVRVTGVGEITQIQGGFYRIFFQSHIFVLIAYFIFLFLLSKIKKIKDIFFNKPNLVNFAIIIVLTSVILLSFSRSFWVAGFVGLLISLVIIYIKNGYKKLLKLIFILLLSTFFSLSLIFAIVKFPYPNPLGGFDTAKLISNRATQIKDEAAVSSRWNLLPEVLDKIDDSLFLGKGYGTTITYKSNDPRILETSANGEYTTYAFEWGWLDIWLKLGLFGLASYLLLLYKIIPKKIINSDKFFLIYGFSMGIILISIVSIFTPYTNHPLGIGYIIFSALLLKIINNKTLA
jgi:hypothetical protein